MSSITNLTGRKNNKRVRLVEAAEKLFDQQGINSTTLANIAELAEVPLGNVYYYFKSKEAIVAAVIDQRAGYLDLLLNTLNKEQSAKHRLLALVKQLLLTEETSGVTGENIGMLAHELSKLNNSSSSASIAIVTKLLAWVTEQFVGMGKGHENANKLAINLISGIQGASIISSACKDLNLAANQAEFLSNWLETAS